MDKCSCVFSFFDRLEVIRSSNFHVENNCSDRASWITIPLKRCQRYGADWIHSIPFNWSGKNAQRRDFRRRSSLGRREFEYSQLGKSHLPTFLFGSTELGIIKPHSFANAQCVHAVLNGRNEDENARSSIVGLSGNIEISLNDSIDGFQRHRIDCKIKWIWKYRRSFQSPETTAAAVQTYLISHYVPFRVIVCKILRSILQLRQLLKLALMQE